MSKTKFDGEQLDDPAFPQIAYRRGAAGVPEPVLRGTGLRVQTVVVAHEQWSLTSAEIAEEYGLPVKQIEEALAFAEAHRPEIDSLIEREARLDEQSEAAGSVDGQT